MEENYNCLICYKSFPRRRRSIDLGLQDYKPEEKLFHVFCKYMQVDEDICDEPFCLPCKEIMWSLHQLNCEIEVLNRLTSRLTAKCIAKIIESRNEEVESHEVDDLISKDERPVNAIRRIIYDRFNAHVVLKREEDQPSSGRDDVSDGSYVQIDLQFEGHSDHDDPEFLMNDDSNSESDDEEWSKGRLTRQMRKIATKTIRQEHGSENQRQSCYEGPKYSEVGPGKYIYRGQLPFRTVGHLFQCESCGKTFEDMEAILSHLRNHLRKRQRRPDVKIEYNHLIEIAPNKLLYANKYPICFVAGKYRCSLCLAARVSKYKLVEHIKKIHMQRGQKGEGTAAPNDKVTVDTGDVKQNPAGAGTDSIGGGEMKTETSVAADGNTLEDAESEQNGGSSVPVGQNDDGITEEFLNPYESGFADPTRPVEESLPTDIEAMKTAERAKSNAFEEISPGRFRLGEFEFEKLGDIFRCSTCHRQSKMKVEMTTHVRKRHYNTSFLTSRRNFSWRELEPSKYLYANEYVVALTGGRYRCPECPKSTPRRHKIMEHIRSVHIIQNAPLICEECGKSFATADSFRCHKRTHETPSFLCSTCSKSFTRREYLERHERIHRGDEAKNKICEYCGKKFFNNSKLLSHLSQHDGEKRFACSHCDQRFLTYDTMRLHRNVCSNRNIKENTEDTSVDENAPNNSLGEQTDNLNDVMVIAPLQTPIAFEFNVESLFPTQ